MKLVNPFLFKFEFPEKGIYVSSTEQLNWCFKNFCGMNLNCLNMEMPGNKCLAIYPF